MARNFIDREAERLAEADALAASLLEQSKKTTRPVPEPFSLDCFALNGQAAMMEESMLNDVFVLDMLAILGQSTVFYAKPNAGKTLLTIWLLIDAIKSGNVKAEDIFYINADDNYKGLTLKLKLAEEYGFRMLSPGYNGFKADMLAHVINKMISTGGASGKVLILDTAKKFTDIMSKDKSTKFAESNRQFVAHGGSVIMLAHVNKNRDDDGKVVFSGTSDLVDDVDCAYTLDTMTEDKQAETRTVKFENFKSRGDVAAEAVYQYSISPGMTYQERLESVRSVSDREREHAERMSFLEARYRRNVEAIQAIRETLRAGINNKTDIIKAAMDRSGITRRNIARALTDHTGSNSTKYEFWSLDVGSKNAHIYRLNDDD